MIEYEAEGYISGGYKLTKAATEKIIAPIYSINKSGKNPLTHRLLLPMYETE